MRAASGDEEQGSPVPLKKALLLGDEFFVNKNKNESTPLMETREKSLSFWIMCLLGSVTALTTASSDAYVPNMPSIRQEFGTSIIMMALSLQLNWFVSGLSGPAWGSLSTFYGRRKALMMGVIIFCGGTGYASLAQNIGSFLLARVIQGVGEGSARAIAETVVCDVYENEEQRAKALATISQWFSVTIVLAPVFGGTVGGALGWRAVFYLLFLFGIFLFLLILCFLPETAPPSSKRYVKERICWKYESLSDNIMTALASPFLAALSLWSDLQQALGNQAANPEIIVGGLCFNLTTNCFAGTMLTLWPYTLEDYFGLSTATAGYLVGSIGIVGWCGAQISKFANSCYAGDAPGLLFVGATTYGIVGLAVGVLAVSCLIFSKGFIACQNLVLSVSTMYVVAIVIFANYPTLLTVMLRDVPADSAGTVVGLNGGVMFIGLALSSAVGSVCDQLLFNEDPAPDILYIFLASWILLGTSLYFLLIYKPSMRLDFKSRPTSKEKRRGSGRARVANHNSHDHDDDDDLSSDAGSHDGEDNIIH